ncbi:MAG: 1-acyl-sn-glycerol-3-phosphate acyltransferase [Pseudomonadales bacterium]|nr:1-acyl-sn-glycerol-3-phosphate acyltransferase [Pseudomonadales bacterium]
MDKFSDIRPYNDDETRPVIESIINDSEFIDSLLALKFPNWPRVIKLMMHPVVRWGIKREVKGVATVADFQVRIETYCRRMIETTMTDFTVSGLDNLDITQAYTFVSNHRDIAMDPAMVNYALHINGAQTVRIAIGDNLLTKEFVSNLMRINKSFIVRRSAKGPRQLMAILKNLSEYINFSIKEDQHSIWIAQREGRAKNGMDKTEAAIIKMMTLSTRKLGMAEAVKGLKIVPVSISYEYDPCDQMKARELLAIAKNGSYEKGEQEDVQSIAKGISGFKGRVHLHFGEVLTQDFESADEVAAHIDKDIISAYVLQPTNYFAYHALNGEYPKGVYSEKHLDFSVGALSKDKQAFDIHMAAVEDQHKPYVLNAYANPIVNKQKFGLM